MNDSLKRLHALQDLAVGLIHSKNPRDLLNLIANQAVELLVCDAASIYLAHDLDHIAFEITVNQSMPIRQFQRVLIPLSTPGIATHVFRSAETLRIADVYQIEKSATYSFDENFDRKMNYRTASMACVPLKTSKGEIVGVIQVMNRKETTEEKWAYTPETTGVQFLEFSEEDEKLLNSFAALASASLENAHLYDSIKNLFNGFATAAIQAIENRDMVTGGHSERVASLCTELGRQVSRSDDEGVRSIRFSDQQISELRYAALLHDFGKIGVKESVLTKAEKLTPMQKERFGFRIEKFKLGFQVLSYRSLLETLHKEQRAPNDLDMARVTRDIKQNCDHLDGCHHHVQELSQPSVMPEKISEKLGELKKLLILDETGGRRPLLTPAEILSLSVPRGSLTEAERKEIESHVTFTYNFLKKIPWTSELALVPDIAFAHHEYLDGTGYPRKIKAEEIPVQSRIMTICDIFDALIASDRPYKKPISVPKALEIIENDTKRGRLDPAVFKVFVEAKVFQCFEFNNLLEEAANRNQSAAKKKSA